MKILSLNARSLKTSHLLIKDYVSARNISLLCITEAMTVEDTPLSKIFNPLHRPRSSSNRGGVAVFYRKDLKGIYPRYDLEDPDLEAVWIETRLNGKSLIIGTIYIPPPDENPKALMALDRVLHFLGPEQSVLLTGDPNCRNLAWEKWHHLVPNQNYYAWKRGTWLLNLADKHGLSIANDGRYTRFEKKLDRYIKTAPDVTLTRNIPTLQWQVDHIIGLNSDHRPIIISFPKPDQKPVKRWNVGKANWPNWHNHTREAFFNFSQRTTVLTAEETMDSLIDSVTQAANTALEMKTICSHSKGFMSDELKCLLAETKAARKRFQNRSDSFNKEKLDKLASRRIH